MLARHFVAREEYSSGEEIASFVMAPAEHCESYWVTQEGLDPEQV